MKKGWIIAVLATMGLYVLTGCGSNSSPALMEAETAVPEFSAKHGLLLPEQTRNALGLKTVEVTEGKLDSTMDLQLRVYERKGETALASGSVTSEEAARLKAGQVLEVVMKNGQSRAAKIAQVSERLARETGLAEVLVEIPDAVEAVSAATFVSAKVKLKSGKSAVTVPRSALLRSSEGQFVYTVSGDHFVRTAVRTGSGNAESVEITDGLYAGDQVVSQPVMPLWMTELAAVKGGQSCCVEPPKGK